MYYTFIIERKVVDNEFPNQLVQNLKGDLPVGAPSLLLRKWIFSTPHEVSIMDNEPSLQLLYQQAVTDIAKKRVDPEDKDGDLRMLKAQKNYREVTKLVTIIPFQILHSNFSIPRTLFQYVHSLFFYSIQYSHFNIPIQYSHFNIPIQILSE